MGPSRRAPRTATTRGPPRRPAEAYHAGVGVPDGQEERGEADLLLRRRKRRGQPGHEGAARRQGRGPGRDEQHRHPGASGFHHHHRGLHGVLRGREATAPGSRAGDARRARPGGGAHRQGLRRSEEPPAPLGALRRPGLDAGDDGHRAEPGPERPDRRGAGPELRQRALRLGQLPALLRDVRGRGAGHEAGAQGGPRSLRRAPRGEEEGARRRDRLRAARGRAPRAGRGVQGGDPASGGSSSFPTTRSSSSRWPSPPSSRAGTTTGRTPTAS